MRDEKEGSVRVGCSTVYPTGRERIKMREGWEMASYERRYAYESQVGVGPVTNQVLKCKEIYAESA